MLTLTTSTPSANDVDGEHNLVLDSTMFAFRGESDTYFYLVDDSLATYYYLITKWSSS